MTRRRLSTGAALLALALAGCSSTKVIGIGQGDSSVPNPHDACGNGMDDDSDGAIDEDCYCGPDETQRCYTGKHATRRFGGCEDGVQRCDTQGAEFGRWAACEGAVGPREQQCDGMDGDCDGAVDEGCRCDASTTRPCGPAAGSGPCQPGQQTCGDDGLWSACAGAVIPGADICGDGVDNDCDGIVDRGCGCVPEPETCDDGADNDCDGTVDEPACRKCIDGSEICGDGVDDDCDGMIDEASCTACASAAEDCGNAYDDDCDGRVDEACLLESCDCTWTAEPTVPFTDGLQQAVGLDATDDTIKITRNPEASVWAIAFTPWAGSLVPSPENVPIHFHQLDDAGAPVGTAREVARISGAGRLTDLVWTGDGYVVLWVAEGRGWGQYIDSNGLPIGEPVDLFGRMGVNSRTGPVAMHVGPRLYVATGYGYDGASEAGVVVRRFESALGTANLSIDRPHPPTGAIFARLSMVWTGSELLFESTQHQPDSPNRRVITAVDGATLVDRSEWTADLGGAAELVYEGGALIACTAHGDGFRQQEPVLCRRLQADGTSPSTAFEALPPSDSDVALATTGCGVAITSYLIADTGPPAPPETLFFAVLGPEGEVGPTYEWTEPRTESADSGGVELIPYATVDGLRLGHFRFRVSSDGTRRLDRRIFRCE